MWIGSLLGLPICIVRGAVRIQIEGKTEREA